MLVGIAYAEMVTAVRESVRSSGLTLGTTILFWVFFFTCMRFFVGNQLHLMSENLLKMNGGVWFFDLMFITLQTLVIIFLGGLSSVEANRNSVVDFVDLLIMLYSIDVLWITSQWGLGKISTAWRRTFVPWAWAILNSLLLISILILHLVTRDLFSNTSLIWLGCLSAIGFVVDLILIDYYELI